MNDHCINLLQWRIKAPSGTVPGKHIEYQSTKQTTDKESTTSRTTYAEVFIKFPKSPTHEFTWLIPY